MQQAPRFTENPISMNDNLASPQLFVGNTRATAFTKANLSTVMTDYLVNQGIRFQPNIDIEAIGSGAHGTVYKINDLDVAAALIQDVVLNGFGIIFGHDKGKMPEFDFTYNATQSYASLLKMMRKGMAEFTIKAMKNLKKKPKNEQGKAMMAMKVELLKGPANVENSRHENAVHAALANDPAVSHIVPGMYAAGTLRVHVRGFALGTLVALRVTFMQFISPSYVSLGDMCQDPRMARLKSSRQKMYEKVRDAFIDLWAAGYSHADAHDSNIVVNNKTKHVCMYDFGFSIKLEPALHEICKQLKEARDSGKTTKANLNRFFTTVANSIDATIVNTISSRYPWARWANSEVSLLKSMHLWVQNPARELVAYKIIDALQFPTSIRANQADVDELEAYHPAWFS